MFISSFADPLDLVAGPHTGSITPAIIGGGVFASAAVLRLSASALKIYDKLLADQHAASSSKAHFNTVLAKDNSKSSQSSSHLTSSLHGDGPPESMGKQRADFLKKISSGIRRTKSAELDLLEQGLLYHGPQQESQPSQQGKNSLDSKSNSKGPGGKEETRKTVFSKLRDYQTRFRHYSTNPRTYASGLENAGDVAVLRGVSYQENPTLYVGIGARLAGGVANRVMDSNDKIQKAREQRKQNDKGEQTQGTQDHSHSREKNAESSGDGKQNKDVSSMVRRNFDDPA